MSGTRKPDAPFGDKRKAPPVQPSAGHKHRRESKLLHELQRDHGYMFARMLRERESYTTQVRGIKSGKLTMTSARVMRVIVPDESWLVAQSVQGRKRAKKAA